MGELFPNISVQTVEECKFNEICAFKKSNSSMGLYTIFRDEARKALDQDNKNLSELYELMSQLYSMMYRYSEPNEPFHPLAVFSATRTAITSDFTEKNMEIFELILKKAGDHVAAARIADVLWLRRRDHQFARIAIDNYIHHANEVLVYGHKDWLNGKDSLHRALQLWIQLNKPEGYETRMKELVGSRVQPEVEEPENYTRVMLLRFACEFNLLDNLENWRKACEDLSAKAKANNNFEKSRDYLECILLLDSKNQNEDNKNDIRIKIATIFSEECRHLRKSGVSSMIVADKYMKAIEAFRRIGGHRDIVDQLHLEMIEVQKQVLTELKHFSFELDVTEWIVAGQKEVESVPLSETLHKIAILCPPEDVSSLREFVSGQAEEFKLMNMISAVSYKEKGRIAARVPPTITTNEDERNAGLLAQVIIECGRRQQMCGATLIESARSALNQKFTDNCKIFEDLVCYNPFVPSGREEIYIQGLKAGLQGNMLVCAHLLIPQLEHSIRTILERENLLTTQLRSDLTQIEYDLNKLLYEKITEKIFGENMTFSLRVLLVEELGGNYRNRLAHGLLDNNDFHRGWINYLWALTIRLCRLGKLAAEKKINEDK